MSAGLAAILLALAGIAGLGYAAWRLMPALPDTASGQIARWLVVGLSALAGGLLTVSVYWAAYRSHALADAGANWSDALHTILFDVFGLLGLAVVVHQLAERHAGEPGR
jgi:hypothetical protein